MSAAAALHLKKTLADAIRLRLAEENMTISDFARKTGTGRHSVRRLLDGKNTAITLKTMAKAANVLDLELTLSVKQLPLSSLEKISRQLASTDDAKEARDLKKRFMEGYYGKPISLIHAQDSAV
jgi:transcriptional regulator with XRE-family HTH domain